MSQPPSTPYSATNSTSSYPYTYASAAGSTYNPGAYQTAAYATPGNYATSGVTSYGTPSSWSYAYNYFPTQGSAGTSKHATSYGTTQAVSMPSSANVATPRPYTSYTAPAPSTSAPAATTNRSKAKSGTHKGLFAKELRNLMYGFGDDRNPAPDTVSVMEEILIEYIIDVCQQATNGRKSRLSIEDLRRVLSRAPDAKKLARMEELLFMQEDIKRARAQFNESEMNDKHSI